MSSIFKNDRYKKNEIGTFTSISYFKHQIELSDVPNVLKIKYSIQ